MDALVYPKERPIIALDYDLTCTLNIPFWQHFTRMAHSAGFDVMIVTARHPERLEEPHRDFGDLAKRIIATAHQAKLPFCKTLGITPAIWIDDQPWNIHLNIDGTVPKFAEMSALVPEFGHDIASYLFPKFSPILVKGYGFFYSDCKYEVPPILQSFHRTKAGAYRAMRTFLRSEWDKHRAMYVQEKRVKWIEGIEYPDGPNFPVMARAFLTKREGKWYGPFAHAEWKIQPHVLNIQE
jgi:hypothetical protein